MRDLKQMVKIATDMRNSHSFALDISNMTSNEAAFITALVNSTGLYNAFYEIQDIPLEKIYVALKLFEAQDEMERVKNKFREHKASTINLGKVKNGTVNNE